MEGLIIYYNMVLWSEHQNNSHDILKLLHKTKVKLPSTAWCVCVSSSPHGVSVCPHYPMVCLCVLISIIVFR